MLSMLLSLRLLICLNFANAGAGCAYEMAELSQPRARVERKMTPRESAAWSASSSCSIELAVRLTSSEWLGAWTHRARSCMPLARSCPRALVPCHLCDTEHLQAVRAI